MSKSNGRCRIDEVLELLSGVHQGTKGFIAFCPAHEDRKKKSLSVGENEKGDVLLKCFAGCSAESVCKALGITLADLFADSSRQLVSKSLHKSERYVYRGADGEPVYQVKRTKDKQFFPYTYDREQGVYAHKAGLNGAGRIPYRLDELTHNTAETVYWVEGERDADRLRAAGLLATTAAGGAQGTLPDLSALEGRNVVIVPDNDEPGRSYGERVAEALRGIAASIKWLDLPGLPAKGDVSDFFDSGASVEEFLTLAGNAPEYSAEAVSEPLKPSRDKPREKKRGDIGHDELRDRWLERYPGMGWSRGDWHRYGNGIWQQISSEVIEDQIINILEDAKGEGAKVTGPSVGSVLRLARARAFVDPNLWDANPDALVLRNGTLDISTRILREHRQEDYATSSLPYNYDPDARASIFEAVVRKAIPEAHDFLQEFAGYSLTTNTQLETAIWLRGPRGCGKSTVIEGLAAMLGERHGILGLAEIEASRFALAKIPGKTLLTSTEQPSSYLKSTHVVDALISGESLMVDRKNRDAEQVTPVAKVIWAMNDTPRVANTTSGIFRRVQLVEFPPLKEEPDPAVKQEIKNEGAGLLNWALDGLSRLSERGKFDPPPSVREATKAFQFSNDLPAMFVDEMCITGDSFEVSARTLYNAYKEWAFEGGHKPTSISRVGEDWKRLGFKDKRTKTGRFWTGVQLRMGQ